MSPSAVTPRLPKVLSLNFSVGQHITPHVLPIAREFLCSNEHCLCKTKQKSDRMPFLFIQLFFFMSQASYSISGIDVSMKSEELFRVVI